jgi:membrane fusion protein (multidrug efflux system)
MRVLFAIAAGVMLLAFFAACSDNSEEAGASAPAVTATPVVLAEAALRNVEEKVQAVGTARADESVELTAKVTEKINKIHFQDGQRVRRNDVLVELISAEESALLNEALATMRERERNYQRIRELYETVSLSELDNAMAQIDSARARVESIEAQLADRLILAPFSGVLGLRRVSPGTLVEPGDVITTLDDVDPIKADFTLPERFLSALAPGQSVRAKARAYPDEIFEGQVSALTPRVDEATRAVTVRALIPNPDFRLSPGMLLSLELVKNRREVLAIPEGALVPLGTEQFVFVFDPGTETVNRRKVTIGLRVPGFVEVTSGVREGEMVVQEGVTRVIDGTRLAPREAPMPSAMQRPREG